MRFSVDSQNLKLSHEFLEQAYAYRQISTAADEKFYSDVLGDYIQLLQSPDIADRLQDYQVMAVIDKVNYLTSPDMDIIRTREPWAMSGLQALKASIAKLQQAVEPAAGIYDHKPG
jgi:hypothetical protein